jgi:hypothetical protein
LSPPGRGNLLYIPPGTRPEWLTDPSLPALIVEGEFKALAAWRLANWNRGTDKPRWLVIAIAGCWNWRGIVGKEPGPDGERRDIKGPISDLDRIVWNRDVILTPDANRATNPSVGAAWRQLAIELERRGARTAIVDLPAEPDVNGIDDLLALWGPERVLALLGGARPRQTARDFHQTDIGNAKRFAQRHGQNVCYVTGWNQWAVWDGWRWRRDDSLKVVPAHLNPHFFEQAPV